MPSDAVAYGKTVCEFFAGIGLVRVSLTAGGWECVYANDIDPKKRAGYVARFGADHFHLGDVAETGSVVARIPGRPVPGNGVVPVRGPESGGPLPRPRRWQAVVRGLRLRGRAGGSRSETAARSCWLENVPGFLTSRGGEDFVAAARRLAELGYWLDAFALDACHFTPQSRPRVFVVGVAAGLAPVDVPEPGRLFPGLAETEHRQPNLARFRSTLTLKTGWLSLPLPSVPARTLRLADVIDTDNGQEWWADAEVKRHTAMMSDTHPRAGRGDSREG